MTLNYNIQFYISNGAGKKNALGDKKGKTMGNNTLGAQHASMEQENLAEEKTGVAVGGNDDQNGSESSKKDLSFDDFLKLGNNQAEFDRRMEKGFQTRLKGEKEKWQAMTDDKLSEADRLAKMNQDEKTKYLQDKREKELSDREATIIRKELKAEAKNTLASDSLPVDLAEILDYSSAEACKASMETVKKTFQKAVEAAVEEKLKGDKPLKKQSNDSAAYQQQIMKLMRGR